MTRTLEVSRAMKFGVEIEVSDIANSAGMTTSEKLRKIADAIVSFGVSARAEALSHNVGRSWKVVTDASCGLEIVSPVLYNFDELEAVCKALKSVGAKINRQCGLHVHHDANGMNLEKIKNVYRIYNKHQEVLDSMMPESRRESNNRFSKAIDVFKLNQIENITSMDRMLDEVGGRREGHYTSKRYYKVNFASYVCYGTLEFRQHSGTIEFEKIKNWVLITHMIMERANMRVNIRQYANYDEVRNSGQLLSRFLKECCISGTDVADYMVKRVRNLKKDEVERVA